MRSRLTIVAVLVGMASVLLPATAFAYSEIGFSHRGSGSYLNPADGIRVPFYGPVLTFHAVNNLGLTGQYSLDAAAFVSAVDGTRVTVGGTCPSVHTFQYRWVDATGTPTDTYSVNTFALDNVAPRTTATNAIRVRQNGYARFRFSLKDGGTESDAVKIKVKTLKGRLVETLYSAPVGWSVSASQTARVKVAIPIGRYRWFVYADDGCGNRQTLVGRNTLQVTR